MNTSGNYVLNIKKWSNQTFTIRTYKNYILTISDIFSVSTKHCSYIPIPSLFNPNFDPDKRQVAKRHFLILKHTPMHR